MRQRKLESDAEDRCRDDICRRTILCCRYGNWNRTRTSLRLRILHSNHAVILKSGPEIKNHCTMEGVSVENSAAIPKSGPEIKNRCTQEGINRQNLASIPKSGLEIKNRCTKEGVNGEKLASIPKSGPEIKNQCTLEGVNRQNLASIRKSGLEIKNRCMQQAIFSTRSLDEPLWRYVGGNLHPRWFDSGGKYGC